MRTRTRSLSDLTACDVMSRNVVRLPQNLPLRDAARLLKQHQIGGAPVVNTQDQCVGVLSATDFLRLAEPRPGAVRPVRCAFQAKQVGTDGQELTLCTLPPGVCPVQVKQSGPSGEVVTVCGQPHCVLADWQLVDVESLPHDEIRRFMTPDPVMAKPLTPVRTLARMMIDAHVHRVIVVDEARRPIGIVSSTDLLAVLARKDG